MWKRVRNNNRRGAAVIEFAVVLPIFILVVFGIVEFGRAMMVQQLLANGARLGARRAILASQTNTQVEQVVTDFCQDAIGATVAVAISVNGVANASVAAAERGDLCEVNVSVPFADVSLLPTSKWMNSATLQTACTMEHE